MPARKKIIYLMMAIGLAIILSLAILTACDNRKAINPKLNINPKVTMSLAPNNLIIHSLNKPDTVEIDVRVRDTDGSGLDSVDVFIYRSPEVGTIVPPKQTERGGFTNALFITDPGTSDNSVITFIAVSGTGADTSMLEITISLATISMTLLPPQLVIHSQSKPDTVSIDIRVRDGDGNGIDSAKVELMRTPTVGTIVSPAATSLGGYTKALFVTDVGATEDMEVIFTATSSSAIDVDTLHMLISLQGEIDTMNISLGKATLTANGEDFTNIYVSVIDTTGAPISDGTVIFMENFGAGISGTIDSTYKFTQNGLATFKLTAPPQIDPSVIIDVDSLHAWGESVSGAISNTYKTINYVPDEPDELRILTIPVDMVAGSGETQDFLVSVKDAHGSYVLDGTQVRFKNNLTTSSITPLTTTENGLATAVYTVGTQALPDQVLAFYNKSGSIDTLWSNPIPIDIRSSEPTNIALSTTDPNIEVGGIATIVKATMQDENSNPLSDGFPIRFEITAAPGLGTEEGPSFSFVPSADTVSLVEVQETNVNGQASITLFSGTRAGTVRIKATSETNESIFKERPLITMQSGPPAEIEIGPSNLANNVGEAIFTGITAQVWDRYDNPVEPKTAVYFTLTTDTSAYIEGFALTGGYPDPEDTTQIIGIRGQANTWMSYTCYHTFDTVRVVSSSGDMADTSEAIVLAIYSGALSVGANPGVLYCEFGNADTVQYSNVEALLQDGLGCPIKNGIVTFTATGCGSITGQSIDTTGVDGYAYARFKILYRQIPQDPPPPGCNAKVKAVLRGYPDVQGETDIYCTIQ